MENSIMTKKDYIQPTMKVVRIKTQALLVGISNTSTQGLDSKGLEFDKKGGNQGNAWSRGNSGWDDEE